MDEDRALCTICALADGERRGEIGAPFALIFGSRVHASFVISVASQGVLRAKECGPYTCPSVHQSFSEVRED